MLKFINNIIKSLVAMFLVIALLGVYITFIERNLLVVKRDTITLGENNDNKVKIVQFSDTQLGEYYTLEDLEKAVNKINKLNADLVVFTGDLIDNASKYEDLYNVSEVLGKIQSNIGKYAIYGNHDIGGGAIRYYANIMSEAGFTLLVNESDTIKVNDKTITMFGGDDALMGNHDSIKTMDGISNDNTNILLIHEPDLIDKYNEYPIDLALSGHSHGGQVYIPFYGPIKSTLLAEKYNKGFYYMDNERDTTLYVSSGLGNTKVPFRFLNIPEIKVFNLYL